jgi:hypothetical protein
MYAELCSSLELLDESERLGFLARFALLAMHRIDHPASIRSLLADARASGDERVHSSPQSTSDPGVSR